MPIIEVRNLSFIYGKGTSLEKTALDNISLSIEKGEFVGIIGHTGSGKSTFVKNLNGLISPTDGKVFVDGVDIFSDSKKLKQIRFKVGMVFQYPEHQLFEETVFKDIAFGPKNMGLTESETQARVLAALDFVGLKSDVLNKSPFDLSGGEKRRAAIAGIIAMDPEVLILDEPTAGLDPQGSMQLLSHIKSYHEKQKKTVILVSHNMEDIAKVCDKVLVLNGGKAVMFDKTEKIFSNEEELNKIGLKIPQITRIMNRIKRHGAGINGEILTVDAAVKEIMKIINGKEHFNG